MNAIVGPVYPEAMTPRYASGWCSIPNPIRRRERLQIVDPAYQSPIVDVDQVVELVSRCTSGMRTA